jgi:hypothetical protein
LYVLEFSKIVFFARKVAEAQSFLVVRWLAEKSFNIEIAGDLI